MMEHLRELTRIHAGIPASDGAGVRMTRLIHTPALEMLDPFLLLDEFASDAPDDYVAGFPDHPHRGFDTVTYMLAGRMRHRDNRGHEGVIGPGGIQWMRAGSGIVHSEMPEQDHGLMWGFQLWINLPAEQKRAPAAYQEFDATEIPEHETHDGAHVRTIAGALPGGPTGPVIDIPTEPVMLDVAVPADGAAEIALPSTHQAFVVVFEGEATVETGNAGSGVLTPKHVGLLGPGRGVRLGAGHAGARALVVAARPLGEPVARAGPFVMNTETEIRQAFADFRAGRL